VVDIVLFKGVRYSEGVEHPTVPHAPVLYSIKNRYKIQVGNFLEPLEET
jgi:hypothetical protein